MFAQSFIGGCLMLENAFTMVLIILIINIIYVSFFTVRMILTLKGKRYIAAFVSVFEIIVYVIGLGLVLDNLNEIQNVLAYADRKSTRLNSSHVASSYAVSCLILK